MPSQSVVIAGEPVPADALERALEGLGLKAQVHTAEGLSDAFTTSERLLEENPPAAAIVVGSGETALTMAITAAKLGIPLAAVDNSGEARAIATLAGLHAGSDIARAADLIAAWLAGDSTPADLS